MAQSVFPPARFQGDQLPESVMALVGGGTAAGTASSGAETLCLTGSRLRSISWISRLFLRRHGQWVLPGGRSKERCGGMGVTTCIQV